MKSSVSTARNALAVKLGFNNTYALALPESEAQRLDISRMSNLAQQPQLRFDLGHEFLERNDGWSGLKRSPTMAIGQSAVSALRLTA